MLDIDLKEIAVLKSPIRTFWSIYLSGQNSADEHEKKLEKIYSVVKSCEDADERTYFNENKKTVETYLKHNPLTDGSMALFVCKQIDYFQAVPIPEYTEDIIHIGEYAYIRPLAELSDEYEDVAVVVADNDKVRIFLVSSFNSESEEEVIKGHIKNHVKVGGWSQQRYERRRDNQLSEYAHEIRDALLRIYQDNKFGHILLVGAREILHIVHKNMPKEFQDKILEKNLDLSKGEEFVQQDIMELLEVEEQQTEQTYWEHIRTEYLRGGLAVTGFDDVFQAAKEGRVDKVLIDHTLRPMVERCQEIDDQDTEAIETCMVCDTPLLFKVSEVNALLRMLIQYGSEFHFGTSVSELGEVGGIAASLRY